MSGFDISPYVDKETGEDADTYGLVFTDVAGTIYWVMDSVELTRAQAFELAAWGEYAVADRLALGSRAFRVELVDQVASIEHAGRLRGLARPLEDRAVPRAHKLALRQKDIVAESICQLLQTANALNSVRAGHDVCLQNGERSTLRVGWRLPVAEPVPRRDAATSREHLCVRAGSKLRFEFGCDSVGRLKLVDVRAAKTTLDPGQWHRHGMRMVHDFEQDLEDESERWHLVPAISLTQNQGPDVAIRALDALRRWGASDFLANNLSACFSGRLSSGRAIEVFWGRVDKTSPLQLLFHEQGQADCVGLRVEEHEVGHPTWWRFQKWGLFQHASGNAQTSAESQLDAWSSSVEVTRCRFS